MKEQTPIGYLFNGRFYKSIDELRGRTMSEDNQPQPLFIESQCKAKVLEALEKVQSDIGEWVPRHMRLKEKQFTKGRIDCIMQISSHIETEVKPKYKS